VNPLPASEARASDWQPVPGGEFWNGYQPGFRFTDQEVGSPEFFSEVEAHRYNLEPHIREFAQFERWRGKDVLEAGCGIATDGLQFARAGARYTGLDQSAVGLGLARRRFEREGQEGRFVPGSVAELPFEDQSFDLVYSFGVIHHTPHTEAAIREFHRVLRPGGTARVMLYHRDSFNYFVNIMLVRRLLVGLLSLPGGPGLLDKLIREDPEILEGHRTLLREHGLRYLTDARLFLSNNTDGPGNPLSKVYTSRQAHEMFGDFGSVATSARFLNLRMYPGAERFARTRPALALGRRFGWHLCISAVK
jgi:SAM-dependent methyltransferase